MTTLVLVIAAATLATAAAAGVVGPFTRPRVPRLERLADPMEDERATLLRSLRELEEERSAGQLSEQDYRALRHETEVRAVAVLRALEARDGTGAMADGLQELRAAGAPPSPDGEVGASGPDRRRVVLAALGGALAVAVVVPILAGSVRSRAPGEPITGAAQGGLAFFEQRVKDHPNDVAARLDLAQRYLEAARIQDALSQYLAVLRLDPHNPEAHAQIGLVLYAAGRPQDGLDAVRQALSVDPNDPEALYIEGLILLRGLHRPADAVAPLQAYLRAAPFGAHVDDAKALLAQAQSGAGASG